MLFFFILLSIVLCLILVFLLYSFDNKLKSQRKKLNILTSQYNSLKKSTLFEKSLFKNIKLQYSKSPYTYGITSKNIKVNYLPIDGFKILTEIKDPLELSILEQCINDSETWFYVDLKMQNNINSRGWIKKNDFSILKDEFIPMNSNLIK